ncbi:MAG: hypothetical protein AB7R99_07480 [Pseudonocardia sp.]
MTEGTARPGGATPHFEWPQDPSFAGTASAPGPAPEQQAATPAALAPAPAPGRRERGEAGYRGRAAFDLGTTTATVAVWDAGRSEFPSLSPAQRRRLADEFADLLDSDPPGPQELVLHWKEFRTELAELLGRLGTVAGTGPSTSAAEHLRRTSGTGEPLHRVIAELERLRVNRGPAMTRFLTARLAHCYDQALQLPPLDSLRYYKANLHGPHQELPSIVWDTGADGEPRFRLLHPDEAGARVGYRGLKQQLGRSTPRVGAGAGAPGFDELMTGALADLVRRTDRYLAQFRSELELSAGLLTDVVVTYPTMAPLAVRDALRAMLHEAGILRVDTDFDEALAAAMFYVLREVGGRTDLAVEAFTARCDPVPGANRTEAGRPTAWRQNVLIVDVGGGTTDVALLELVLHDETDRTAPGAGSPHYGRYFRLRPTLLGTTGAGQRGGDYLTLQVFRWLKILLADHVLTTVPAVRDAVQERLGDRFVDRETRYLPGRLVEVGLGGLPNLREAARAAGHVVPTEWRDSTPGRAGTAAQREQLFGKLWSLAETAKRDLGTKAVADIDEVRLRELRDDVLDLYGQSTAAAVPAFALRQEDFVGLVGDEVGHVMDFAADLARVRLSDLPRRRGLPEQPLHEVVLTGRGSLLPLVRSELVRALDSRFGGSGGEVRRVPPVVGYGDEFAKHAASIGACWAATVDTRAQRDVQAQLAEGATWLTVDVDNLFRSMRAAFVVRAPGGVGSAGATRLFGMDAELRMTDTHPEPVVRSDWVPYQNPFLVDRVQGTDTTVEWAHLRLEEYLAVHPVAGFELRHEQEDRLYVQVEAAASLDIWAWLCCGRTPMIDLGAAPTRCDLRAKLGEPGEGGTYDRVPATVEVDRAIDGFLDDGGTRDPVFRAGDPFDRTVEVNGERRRARVGGPLPTPRESGWAFSCRAADQDPATTHPPDLVAAPPVAAGRRHHAVLDDRGVLHVVAGEPGYRAARDLQEVFEDEGTALRIPMTSGEPDYKPVDDPFTGHQ